MKKYLENLLYASLTVVGLTTLVASLNTHKPLPSPRIEEYRCADSQYILVHVRQQHARVDKKESAKQRAETKQIQSEIYYILTGFVNKGITNIYREGLTELAFEESMQNLNKVKGKRNSRIFNKLKEEILFEYGATVVLALEDKIQLKAAEDFSANLDAKLIVQQGLLGLMYSVRTNKDESMSSFRERIVHEQREDALLEIIHTNSKDKTNEVHVTVYGSAHDFRDNIKKWNAEHPTKKFSLITLTPPTIVQQETTK